MLNIFGSTLLNENIQPAVSQCFTLPHCIYNKSAETYGFVREIVVLSLLSSTPPPFAISD
jgi:hypothetical protein